MIKKIAPFSFIMTLAALLAFAPQWAMGKGGPQDNPKRAQIKQLRQQMKAAKTKEERKQIRAQIKALRPAKSAKSKVPRKARKRPTDPHRAEMWDLRQQLKATDDKEARKAIRAQMKAKRDARRAAAPPKKKRAKDPEIEALRQQMRAAKNKSERKAIRDQIKAKRTAKRAARQAARGK
jgi:hypothetical protein